MATIKIGTFTFEGDNGEELRTLKREIFGRHIYYAELKTRKPKIIDAGAHIGMATGYFKWLYPEARITAIEPNPRLVMTLNNNIWRNKWSDVEVEEVALAEKSGKVRFYFDKSDDHWYSTGGLFEGAWNGTQKSWGIEVWGKPLEDYLEEPVDLVKLDIEGMETAVLKAAGAALQAVGQLIIEYHPRKEAPLIDLEDWLRNRDYKVTSQKQLKTDKGLVMVEAVKR